MKTDNKPTYIEYGGDVVLAPPYDQQDCGMSGFLFKSAGGIPKLQKILDQRLNFASASSRLRYECVMPYVMLMFANTKRSLSIPQKNLGYTVENEMVAWVLAKEQIYKKNEWIDNRLVWFIPYIAVDSIIHAAVGREVCGYPKTVGKITMPEDPKAGEYWGISVPAFKTYSPGECLREHPLFGIKKNTETPERNMDNAIAFLNELKNWFASKIEKDSFSWRMCLHETMNLMDKTLNSVFLKQFRDSDESDRACYQAIINGSFKVADFKTASFLGFDNYTLSINDLAGYPMREELGLTDGQNSELAFYLKIDMLVPLGKELWKA